MEQNGITLAINAKEYLTEFLSLNEAIRSQKTQKALLMMAVTFFHC